MESGQLDSLRFTDDDDEVQATLGLAADGDRPSKVRVSPFVILVDSNEKYPFNFSSIIGDSVDAHAAIDVRTERKRLKTGDYQIKGFPSGITIERKSKADLFSSVHPGQRRDDFIERLGRMERMFQNSVVLVECYPSELYENPIEFGSLNPKMVYRTTLSWGLQFGTAWHWAADRETAAQVAYRILEKWYDHETNTKYVHHNRPIANAVAAFDEGQVARHHAATLPGPDYSVPYPPGSPYRLEWTRGWNIASVRHYNGDLGFLHDGPVPGTPDSPPKKAKRKQAKSSDPAAEAKAFFGKVLK